MLDIFELWTIFFLPLTALKASLFGVFLVRIFPHSVRIQSKSEKILTRKTPNTDTFYAVTNTAQTSSEAYSEPCQTSKMVNFAKIYKVFQLLTIFAKCSVLDVWQHSEYVSALQVKWFYQISAFSITDCTLQWRMTAKHLRLRVLWK